MTHTTVRETKRRMSIREFFGWMEEYKRMPWGNDWMQAGTVAAAVLQPWSKKRRTPLEFVPCAKQKQTPEQMEKAAMRFAKRHNRAIELRDKQRSR